MTLGELIGPEAALPAAWAAVPITGLAADSRQVEPGYLFAAMPGVNTDGARFIADALERGAAAILTAEGAAVPQTDRPVVTDPDPRRRLALTAARFFGPQPKTQVAVTGTNGKTSVAAFVRQLWAGQGFQAASLGTVGVVTPAGTQTLRHTTPDPIELHAILAGLARDGVTHLALEASSHGLQQRRIDGVTLAAGAFTNISRDHLDYHASFEDYFAQKLRLFRELLPKGAAAVVDADSEGGTRVADEARMHGLEVITVGAAGDSLRLVSCDIDGFAQRLVIEHASKRYDVRLPLVGGFQAANALVAAGLCLATGGRAEDVLPRLADLQGARGRLDLAGTAKIGAPPFAVPARSRRPRAPCRSASLGRTSSARPPVARHSPAATSALAAWKPPTSGRRTSYRLLACSMTSLCAKPSMSQETSRKLSPAAPTVITSSPCMRASSATRVPPSLSASTTAAAPFGNSSRNRRSFWAK